MYKSQEKVADRGEGDSSDRLDDIVKEIDFRLHQLKKLDAVNGQNNVFWR